MVFCDGLDRVFVPYKGYVVKLKDGSLVPDPLTRTDEGPFKIIIDTPSHDNWHTLFNLVDNTGMKIFQKGVRKIEYYSVGFYLAEDNNKDELINTGDVKGGFRLRDYRETSWIVLDNGKVYSDGKGYAEIVASLKRLSRCGFVGRYQIDRFMIENGRIVDESYNPDESEYTSAMWTDCIIPKMADCATWGMNVINRNGHKHYYLGEGNEIISYAHEVLISHRGTIFLEKDGAWYLRWPGGRMVKCFFSTDHPNQLRGHKLGQHYVSSK